MEVVRRINVRPQLEQMTIPDRGLTMDAVLAGAGGLFFSLNWTRSNVSELTIGSRSPLTITALGLSGYYENAQENERGTFLLCQIYYMGRRNFQKYLRP